MNYALDTFDLYAMIDTGRRLRDLDNRTETMVCMAGRVIDSRAVISPATAALFRTPALSVKLALLPFSGRRTFEESRVCRP